MSSTGYGNDGLLLILKAAESAAHWHSGQKRKGAAGEPYVNHLIEVARLVAAATQGSDPNLIAAAFLHDAVEDQKVPLSEIATKYSVFGARADRRQVLAKSRTEAATGRACAILVRAGQNPQAGG